MKIIVGLGNPGTEYQNTRHNLGAHTVEQFRERHHSNFSHFEFEKRWNALIAKGSFAHIGGEKIILALPQTFMNASGESAGPLFRFHKLLGGDLWIVHDDLDLPLGALRISVGASAGGHHGAESVIHSVGSSDFPRFRIGIGPRNEVPAEKFVLERFSREEEEKLGPTIARACDAIEAALKDGVERAMNYFNG
jgi:PTH1 family peptidyl-tRNA hydrolase